MPADEITCREVLDLLTEYLEGALAPEVEQSVAEHLDGCDHCRDSLGAFRAAIEATGSLREEDVPDDVRRSLIATFLDWNRPRR